MIKVKVNNEYKDVVKIFCGGTLQKEIIKVWSREAQEYVYESSVEYTGALPITINANGDALIDYRIYGADGGVGVATENLFDMRESSQGEGYVPNAVLRTNNSIVSSPSFYISAYLKIRGNLIYNIFFDIFRTSIAAICFYKKIDNDFIYISSIAQYISSRFTSPQEAEYVRFTVDKDATRVMLVEGSTVPTSYIPYGYKLPMTIGDGNTAQTVPVYIGEARLDEGEYVSYGEQKIYRDVDGTLTPTDPPAPLPEIPTIDGTTVIDYDGDPKPSQMYVKYRR